MTTPTTTTVLDERTVADLAPPCDQHKPGTLEPCPHRADWIVRLVSRITGQQGPASLICDEHLLALKKHMNDCPVHSRTVLLKYEPLR